MNLPAPPRVSREPTHVSWPVDWNSRAYHFRQGLWELSGQLREGRGVFRDEYHDGGSRTISMRLASVRRRGDVTLVELVEDPAEPDRGPTTWYGCYTVVDGEPHLVESTHGVPTSCQAR